jgi:chaperonin GroEL (HSP60 family)
MPGLMSDPIELNVAEADPAGKAAGTALLAKLLKYPNTGAALSEAAYPRKAGDGKTTDMVAWAALVHQPKRGCVMAAVRRQAICGGLQQAAQETVIWERPEN